MLQIKINVVVTLQPCLSADSRPRSPIPRSPKPASTLHGGGHKDRVNGTPAGTRGQRRGKPWTQKYWGPKEVKKLVGQLVNANPAPGHLATTQKLCEDLRRPNTWVSRKCLSTLEEAASCCHPALLPPGSQSSGSGASGLAPGARADHDGGSNPMIRKKRLLVLKPPPSGKTVDFGTDFSLNCFSFLFFCF